VQREVHLPFGCGAPKKQSPSKEILEGLAVSVMAVETAEAARCACRTDAELAQIRALGQRMAAMAMEA
jgi:hypothetical protein